jgi:hypothetical protein
MSSTNKKYQTLLESAKAYSISVSETNRICDDIVANLKAFSLDDGVDLGLIISSIAPIIKEKPKNLDDIMGNKQPIEPAVEPKIFAKIFFDGGIRASDCDNDEGLYSSLDYLKQVFGDNSDVVKEFKVLLTDHEEEKQQSPRLPNRPRNAYVCFCNDVRQKLIDENPNSPMTSIIIKMSSSWQAMTDERAKYDDMAKADNLRYEKEMNKYRADLKKFWGWM